MGEKRIWWFTVSKEADRAYLKERLAAASIILRAAVFTASTPPAFQQAPRLSAQLCRGSSLGGPGFQKSEFLTAVEGIFPVCLSDRALLSAVVSSLLWTDMITVSRAWAESTLRQRSRMSLSRQGFSATAARHLGDIQVTVQSAPSASKAPRTSVSLSGPVELPEQYTSPYSGLGVSFGAPQEVEMSAATSEGEPGGEADDSADRYPSAVVAPSETDAELSAMLLRAAKEIGLEVPKTQELVRTWRAPHSSRPRPSSSPLASLDGGAARGYEAVPQVERAVAVHLYPRGAATWRDRPHLPSKACKFPSALAGRTYHAAGQAATALHAMATLQVYQAKVLKHLHEKGSDQGAMEELCAATDFALRATKVTARSLGQVMSTIVVQERHLWLTLPRWQTSTNHGFLTLLSPRAAYSATPSRTSPSSSRQFKSRQRRLNTSCPTATFQPRPGRPPAAAKKQPAPSPAEPDVELPAGEGRRQPGGGGNYSLGDDNINVPTPGGGPGAAVCSDAAVGLRVGGTHKAGVTLGQVFRPTLRRKHVLVRTDSTATVAYINRQGGLRSRRMSQLARHLLLWSQTWLKSLRAVHIPGELNRAADQLSRQSTHPGEWRLHPETVQLIWSHFGEAQIDLFASPESSHCQLFYSLDEAPLGRDALAHSWPPGPKYAFPPVSLLAQTLCKIREDEEQVLLVVPYWPTRTWFPELISLAAAPPWKIPLRRDLLSQGMGTIWHTARLVPGRDASDLSGLPQAVIETITQSRAPSTRQAYALRWGLFVDWCSSRGEDPQRCTIAVVLSFLQEKLECRLSPSTLKVFVAAIAAYHDAVDGTSLGKLQLTGLREAPFEPLVSVELKYLSLMTALLTALASIKRVGDLQAFSVDEACLEFGPGNSHVILRPRPGYVPKVPTTPFRDQVVNLQALPLEEADPASALLCPVRALRIYVDRTRHFRRTEQLFVCFGGQQKGNAVSKQRLAHWVVDAISLSYQNQGEPCPLGVRAHSTRSVASSYALAHGASLADICRAAGWATPNTFARFYNLRVEAVSSLVPSGEPGSSMPRSQA
ncbi:Tyrosine recombinase slr0733 [Labeo rohita]|uniref:Tyrosine recombinase slr0733 n=1 Tax=Labeo rohita TaxID=84645 RepID=A0ABQ8ME55_LABRO|nr:Tyrosine recombinase slr0733 [Labeo rohita]